MNIYAEGVEILRRFKKEQKIVNSWFYVQEQKMEIIKKMKEEKSIIMHQR